jgi:hypothetical protein
MKTKTDMLAEYDFSKGIRGKYAQEYAKGVNVVKLDDDVGAVFSDAKAVNEALRTFIKLFSNAKPPMGAH